mgnify:FL=1|tara:strand:- start:788 stop:907 length:120 start_codon:yes stop_codon:yes gene_type:complete
MYCFRQGVQNVFDWPRKDAAKRYKQLVGEGWVIYHTIEV